MSNPNEKTQKLEAITDDVDVFEELHPLFKFAVHPASADMFALPWQRDGYVFATDRTMIIRCNKGATHGLVDNGFGLGIDLERLDSLWGRPRREVEAPDKNIFDLTNPKCGTCGGRGTAFCDFGHAHDCGDCNGTWLKTSRVFRWGPNAFSAYYLREIRKYNCRLFAPIAFGDPLRFEVYNPVYDHFKCGQTVTLIGADLVAVGMLQGVVIGQPLTKTTQIMPPNQTPTDPQIIEMG